MSVADWSVAPDANDTADPTIPALDGASTRKVPELIRNVMAGVSALASDQGGAIVTEGAGNAYVARTASRISRLRPGLRLLLKIDRPNTDAPFLNVDGTGPRPWLDRNGVAIPAGGLGRDQFVPAIWDQVRGAWLSDLLGGLTTAVIDASLRAWWLSLPTAPEGIGPNAPWRNGGTLAWTDKDNPAFTIDSPEGRRLTLRLIRDALPTSPDGLGGGEPWLNGDTIAFVPPDVIAGPAAGASIIFVDDKDYQALTSDAQIGMRTLTAPRTIYLPNVALYPFGQTLMVADVSGQCSPDRPITVATNPDTNDTIAGAASVKITDASSSLGFRRGAANLWILA